MTAAAEGSTEERAGGWRSHVFNRRVAVAAGLAAFTGGLCYFWRGADVFWQSLQDDGGLVARVIPTAIGSIVLSACLRVLVPETVVRRWLGEGSGLTGLAIASAIGMFVPGGPITSFPLIVALMAAGADIGVTIAFLTSWSALSTARIIVWEYPLFGGRFVTIRFLACLVLPIVAGMLARRLPIRVVVPGTQGH